MTDILTIMQRWLQGERVWTHDEIIQNVGPEFAMYRKRWAPSTVAHTIKFAHTAELYVLRQDAIKKFGFIIPCAELLDRLEENQPIVEIGAGTGYMTRLMRNRGIDVVGTDPGIDPYGFVHGAHDSQQKRLQGKTAVRHYRERTVFCSWPSLKMTWFRQALRAMRPGQRAIIVEEDSCAEDSTWDYRDLSFKREDDIPLPAWPWMNDRAGLWVKKRHRNTEP